MTEIIVGVDIGTGSTKIIAFDINNSTILHACNESYPTEYHGDQHEQDPALVYNAFEKALKRLMAKLPAHKLPAIVFSSALHSLIAVDKNGKPLTNCIIWSDSRSSKLANEIRKSPAADGIYYGTGTAIHPMSPLCKIAYIKQQHPDVFRNTYKFISIKEYILHQLGHKFLIDHSLASATGLFDVEKLQWHPAALEAAGISPDQLSSPVPVTHLLKAKKNDRTRYLGIKEGTPMMIGGGDGPMANLGSMTLTSDQGCLTLGTSGAFRITTKKILKDPAKRIFNYIIDDNLYVAGGAVNNGGIVLKWLQGLFTPATPDTGGMDFGQMLDVVATVKPGTEGLVFLPWILGERAPVWETGAEGIYYGISFHHKQGHFIRSGLEGVCFNLLNIANIMQGLSGKIVKVDFNGGLSQSDFFCQMIADIFEMEINVTPGVDLSAYGAVVLALKGLGHINNFNQAPKLNKQPVTFHPNDKDQKTYRQNFRKFMALLNFNSTANFG